MPRKSKRSEEKKREEEKKRSSKAKATTTVRKRKSFDIDQWVLEHSEELSLRLGIYNLKLDQEILIIILKRVVELLWDEDKKPDIERISSRIKRNLDSLRSVISQMILEYKRDLTPDQLEFVVSSGGPWIIGYASQLYRYAKDLKREDLIISLKYQWVKWWSSTRDQELPPECPNCGFNALMPDGVCIVCGYTPTATEILKYYHFDDYVEKLYKRNEISKIKRIVERGYVLISSIGIKHPDEERSKYDLEVYIPRSYRERLISMLGDREKPSIT
ncbi:MAG: hypothetical protein ABWJ42_06520 [Sulfolobales archaeon]